MKLRSGAQVVQTASGGIAQNPKTFQTIAQHNASSPFLMLPQEIKNRIYHFVCGGQMVHILQTDKDYKHIHGDSTVELSHAVCIQSFSEKQIQTVFDSADPDTVPWNIATVEGRHDFCHLPPPPKQQKGPRSNQLSLTLLRSCRQIYLEANSVHYTNNTFAFFCHDVLERFVRVRYQNKQNLAIRSLYLDISIMHTSSIDAWTNTINKVVLRRLKSVRFLYLNLMQIYCQCTIEICGYEENEMTRRQSMIFTKLGKLPLKEATMVVDDSEFLAWADVEQDYYDEMVQHRWTMKEKQEFSKEVRDALLE